MGEFLLGDVPERNAVRLGADRPAIRYDGEALSWGELAGRVLRRAHALKAKGVGVGDRVVITLPNGLAFHEIVFALWKLGATPAVVSARMPREELREIVALARPRLVIADDPALQLTLHALPADFGRDHPDTSPLETRESPCWKIMTSGGSTGRPKLIVDALGTRFPDGISMLRMPTDAVIAVAGPLSHNMPFATAHSAMAMGNAVAGLSRFDPEAFLRLVAQSRAQWVVLVPTMMNRIARLPQDVREKYDLSSLQTVWHTAAPIHASLKRFWIDWLGPERIWEIYGGTEGFATTMLSGTEWLAHPGSVGRPAHAEILIRGPAGEALPPGEVGEIYMRRLGATGETRSYHYEGAEARRLPDGFESFGDFGSVDEAGYLYIADRRTDMILSGGHNVFPAEVEAALMEHPDVAEAVVIGLPDEDMGARVHALVRLEDGAAPVEAADLINAARERLVSWKLPRAIEFVTGPLRDEAGKVRRARLRQERLPEER